MTSRGDGTTALPDGGTADGADSTGDGTGGGADSTGDGTAGTGGGGGGGMIDLTKRLCLRLVLGGGREVLNVTASKGIVLGVVVVVVVVSVADLAFNDGAVLEMLVDALLG